MPSLSVHVAHEPDPEELSLLRERLDPNVRLSVGTTPHPATFAVLVAGVPDEALLDASTSLRKLIIPWAGLPVRTRERLLNRPHIAAHNLHHNAPAVAEFSMALLLSAAKHIVPIDGTFRRGDWTSRYQPVPSLALGGRRAVILGYGEIGRRVARSCVALGMDVLATCRTRSRDADGVTVHPPENLHAIVEGAAALVVTLPLTDATRGLVDGDVLARLASDAIVVNVGRGAIIDERALFEALRDGHIGGAGLDVWYSYPPNEEAVTSVYPSSFPFHELPNVVMSPHRSSAIAGSERLRMEALAGALNAAARGEPLPHPVDVEAGY